MNTMFAAFLGGWEIVLILAVVLILFGAKKLPELARGLGQGIREFKKASREVTDEIQNAADDTPTASPQRKLPANGSQPPGQPTTTPPPGNLPQA
jgi:sec-independent protein translocase protein TatA